jgi:hypothetical protein
MLIRRSRRGPHIMCGPLLAVVLLAAACGQGVSGPSGGHRLQDGTDEERGLMNRKDFMKAMPDAFLTTTGPITLPNARKAFSGCNNESQGILSGASLDDTFASEEVTNNDPQLDRIISVMDSRWASAIRYDLAGALRHCGVPFRIERHGFIEWTVTREPGTSTWAATFHRDGQVFLLMVSTTGAAIEPDPECLDRLVIAWRQP